jgi:predicted DNA-binding transcriptional regulator YafY
MSKTERLYKIQKLLSEQTSVSMERFMSLLEVSRSTLKRDLEYLRDRLGAPIIWDQDLGGYRLNAKSGEHGLHQLPGLWLTEAEISALLASIELLTGLEPGPLIGNQIKPLRERLERILERSNFPVSEIRERIKLVPIGQRKTEARYFQAIALAVLERKRLHIRHFGRLDGQITEREVSPLRLVHYKDNWYLDAFCHLRDDLRSFAVDAIEAVSETDKVAVSVEDTVLAKELDAGYGIFAGKVLKKARLKFSPFRSRWVSREIWHPEQLGQMTVDGSYLLEVPYLDDRELIHDLLKEGREVTVIEPAELREKLIEELLATSAIYQ